MKDVISLAAVRILRLLLRICWFFPVDSRKVVLTAYNGRQFGCSPKYMAQRLAETDSRVYYALKNPNDPSVPEGIHVIGYRSPAYFYHLMTAKYIVVNSSGLTDLLPYRKKQRLINTWHGGGYFKTMGNDFFVSRAKRAKRRISGKNTFAFFASCEPFAEQLLRSMSLRQNAVYRSGLPRNDVFFGDNKNLEAGVYSSLGIPRENGIILYAPTYRDGLKASVRDSGYPEIDVQKVLAAAEERFGRKFVFLYRAHHDMIPENLSDDCMNVSAYSDMQELLLAASILITDYSSCMWDYSLQRKPGFLYAPDLREYEKGHSFGTKTEDWPFPICGSNEELAVEIRTYNEESGRQRIEHYLARMQSYEDGHATERAIRELMPDLEV